MSINKESEDYQAGFKAGLLYAGKSIKTDIDTMIKAYKKVEKMFM